MKVDVSKDDIRKSIVDLPMDKNYKISCQVETLRMEIKVCENLFQDFCRTPILSDEVFKLMDRNNDGQISKVLIISLLYLSKETYICRPCFT